MVKNGEERKKPTIFSILTAFDISTIVAIFILLLIFFNSTVAKLLTETASDSMKSRSARVGRLLDEAYTYVDKKPEIDSPEVYSIIYENVINHALNELEYDRSLAALLIPDGSLQGGTRYNRSEINNPAELTGIEPPSGYSREAELIRFRYGKENYIGTAQLIDKKGKAVLLVLGDREADFFSRLYNIRNMFLIFTSAVLVLIIFIKILNTLAVTAEIRMIRNQLQKQGDIIQNEGLLTNTAEPQSYGFLDTNSLAGSFYYLKSRIENLGGIVEGIADKDLVKAALRDDESVLAPHEENMAVLFLDIQGFTTLSEKHGSGAMAILNSIWDFVQAGIERHGGKLNKFIGDACLVIFPENESYNGSPSKRAMESATELITGSKALQKELGIEFAFRLGLDYGTVVYGKTGSEKKYELGVIGDAVNTASRLESLNKQYGTRFLFSQEVLDNAGGVYRSTGPGGTSAFGNFSIFRIDAARPKGKRKPKYIYSLLLKDQQDRGQYRLIGLDWLCSPQLIELHRKYLLLYEQKISLWNQLDKEEAVSVWKNLAHNWAVMTHKYGFTVADMFVERFITAESFLSYKRNPRQWLTEITVEPPDSDWIQTGYFELKK